MHISQSWGGITFLSSFLWHIRTDSVTVMSVHTCIVIYRWWELTGWAKMTFAADELHCSELRNAAVSFLSCLSAFSVSSPLTLREGFGPACQELALVAWPQWHLLNKSVTLELTLCKMIGLRAWMISGTIWLSWAPGAANRHQAAVKSVCWASGGLACWQMTTFPAFIFNNLVM